MNGMILFRQASLACPEPLFRNAEFIRDGNDQTGGGGSVPKLQGSNILLGNSDLFGKSLLSQFSETPEPFNPAAKIPLYYSHLSSIISEYIFVLTRIKHSCIVAHVKLWLKRIRLCCAKHNPKLKLIRVLHTPKRAQVLPRSKGIVGPTLKGNPPLGCWRFALWSTAGIQESGNANP